MSSASVKPVYVLHGSDEFLRDHHRREVVSAAIGDSDPQVCVSTFDSTVELAVVLDELRTLPFLAPHRVVIVTEADAFVSACREGLEKYVESPASTGTLVLVTSSWPSNTRLAKAVAKVGLAIDCSYPDKENIIAWIGKSAGKRGKKITADAAELLAQWVGRDLAGLSGELDKLSLYANDRPTITEQDIAALVTSTAGPGAFDLTNAITAGNAATALKCLSGMLTKRGEEFKVLGLIAWHLRRAVAAQQALKAGQPPDRALPRMPYDQRNAFAAMLRRRTTGKFLNDFRRMIRADLAMKSGAEPLAAMQDLVVGLCS